MAPTNPAEQAKQSLDGSIKRFLLEQCHDGGSRKEVRNGRLEEIKTTIPERTHTKNRTPKLIECTNP